MNITLEKSSNVDAILKVSLQEADYQASVDKKLKDYRKKANFKGFRQGMVPMSLVQKLVGKSILIDEVNHTLGHAVNDYIKENKLQIVGDPMPNREEAAKIDWNTQKDFEFSYELGLAGDFTVDIASIPAVNAYEIEVSQESIAKAIDDVRNRYSENAHPESVEAGDMVFGQLVQESTSFDKQTGLPTKKMSANGVAQLAGKNKGESVTLDILSLFDDSKDLALAIGVPKDEIEGVSGEFVFTIEDIIRSVPAELGQELYDKAFGEGKVTNEDEMIAEITKILSENYQRESAYLTRYTAEKSVIDSANIELPRVFLKKWLTEINEGKVTEEQIDNEFEMVLKDIRWSLVKNRIAQDADIKVDYEQVIAATKDMIKAQFGGYSSADLGEEFYDRMASNYLADKNDLKGSQDRFMQMYERAFSDKVGEYIAETITKVSQKTDIESFQKIAEETYA
jgi:trigger factor